MLFLLLLGQLEKLKTWTESQKERLGQKLFFWKTCFHNCKKFGLVRDQLKSLFFHLLKKKCTLTKISVIVPTLKCKPLNNHLELFTCKKAKLVLNLLTACYLINYHMICCNLSYGNAPPSNFKQNLSFKIRFLLQNCPLRIFWKKVLPPCRKKPEKRNPPFFGTEEV